MNMLNKVNEAISSWLDLASSVTNLDANPKKFHNFLIESFDRCFGVKLTKAQAEQIRINFGGTILPSNQDPRIQEELRRHQELKTGMKFFTEEEMDEERQMRINYVYTRKK